MYIGSGICTPKLFITNSDVDKGIMRVKDQFLVQKEVLAYIKYYTKWYEKFKLNRVWLLEISMQVYSAVFY